MSTPITIVIPTYNAGNNFEKCAYSLLKQTATIKQVIVIDSTSNDKTVDIAKSFGFSVDIISKKDFGHGKTRQYALKKADTEIVVFMTQDALLADKNSIDNLVDFLQRDKNLAAVYGRQLPYLNAGVLGRFARLYNYPNKSFVNTFGDIGKKGIKTAFLSDSFSAYRKSILQNIGGFPKHVNFGEDTYVAAKLLLAGYKTGYCAEARVYHSHDYGLYEDYLRSKTIGKFHKEEHWLLDIFGKAEGEGIKYVFKELGYLFDTGKLYLLPVAFLHNVLKFIGYRMGYLR